MAAAVAEQVLALVDRDAQQPCLEVVFILEVGGLLIELDERVLEAILGIRPVLQPHHTGGGNVLGILAHSLFIAQAGIQLAVAFAHFVPPFTIYTHEKPIWFQVFEKSLTLPTMSLS